MVLVEGPCSVISGKLDTEVFTNFLSEIQLRGRGLLQHLLMKFAKTLSISSDGAFFLQVQREVLSIHQENIDRDLYVG